MTRSIRRACWLRVLLALVCTLVALVTTAPASARVAPLEASQSAPLRAQDSRLDLNGQIAYYTYCFSLREPRLASENGVTGLRRASDPSLRWKARPLQVFGGTEVYDMRARQWVPELGAFLSIDEYRFHDARGTLWSWPRQNPLRYSDPSGHDEGFPVVAVLIGGAATVLGFGMSAPSDTSAAPADLLGMMSSVPGPSLAGMLIEGAAERVPGLATLLGKRAPKAPGGGANICPAPEPTPGGDSGVTLFHGTNEAGAQAIMSEGLQPVSTNTGKFPPGSFFTHMGEDADLAASHWAANRASPGNGPVLLEGTMSREAFESLSSNGLIQTGPTPGFVNFPPQTVILPSGLQPASDAIQWSRAPLRF